MDNRFIIVETNPIGADKVRHHIFDNKTKSIARFSQAMPDFEAATNACAELNQIDDPWGPDQIVRKVPKVVVQGLRPGERPLQAPIQQFWFVVENRISGERYGEHDTENDAIAQREELIKNPPGW